MRATGPLWWLWAWAVWIAFQFLLLALYPTVIAPLFNKFSPLPPGAARATIEALLARCGFANRGLYVMDGSRRSSHGNAFFTGFGRAKRIVFFDTLLERLTPDEVEAVLAHELGHFKLKHVLKRMLWMAILLARLPRAAGVACGVAVVLRGTGRAAGDGSTRRGAHPLLSRAAGVHVRVRPAFVVLFAPARVRGRRVRRQERLGHVARARAREALRGQRRDAYAGPGVLGFPRLASAGRRAHRAARGRLKPLPPRGRGGRDRSALSNCAGESHDGRDARTRRNALPSRARRGSATTSSRRRFASLPGWTRTGGRIEKTFRFADYHRTMAFVNAVASIAHGEDHHPDLTVHYDRCVVAWSTHSAGGITRNDCICAAKVEAIEP